MVSIDLRSVILDLKSVYYTPAYSLNSLPCSRFDEHGISLLIAEHHFILIDRSRHDTITMKIPRRETDGLYIGKSKCGKTIGKNWQQ